MFTFMVIATSEEEEPFLVEANTQEEAQTKALELLVFMLGYKIGKTKPIDRLFLQIMFSYCLNMV